MHPRGNSELGPAAASPCPGGLSQSLQILRALAAPERELWQGKRFSAAAAPASVGHSWHPNTRCSQQRAGIRLFSGVSASVGGLRSFIKYAKEPLTAALRMGMSEEGSRLEMGPASRRWALITLSCTQHFTSRRDSWCLCVRKLLS